MQSQFTTAIAGSYCNFHQSNFSGEIIYHLSIFDEGKLNVYFMRKINDKWEIPHGLLTESFQRSIIL